MKFASCIRYFSALSGAAIWTVPLLGLLASCSTPPSQDVGPASQPVATAPAPARPTQPDGYPNINVPVEAASPQLDKGEQQQLVDDLTTLRQRQADGPGPGQASTEAQRLRLLARSHAERTLGTIEASE